MITLGVLLAAGLAGCAVFEKAGRQRAPVPGAVQVVAAPVVVQGASAEALDQTTEAEKAAALESAGAAGERELGRVVVALGSPAEQGFWLKSALIATPAKGRVVTEGGASVTVELRPGSGAALLSLAAFRALGLGLTDLPEVTVYAE